MGSDHELAARLLEQGRPQLVAGALPAGKITVILGRLVGRIEVAGILPRPGVEKRDVAKGHQEGSRGNVLAPERVLEPCCLCLPIGGACKQAGQEGVGVELVLARVESYQGHVAHTDGKVASQLPVAGGALLGLALHPHALQLPAGHTPIVVVARAKEIGDARSIVGVCNLGRKEDGLLGGNGFFAIGGVTVPHHTLGGQLQHLVDDGAERAPLGMGVVDDTEMGVRLGAGRGETVDGVVLLAANDAHGITALVLDAVGSDAVVIARGGLEPRQAHLHHLVVHVRDHQSAAFHRLPVAQVGLPAKGHIAVGHGTHGESHAHAVLGIVLEHGTRSDETVPGRSLCLQAGSHRLLGSPGDFRHLGRSGQQGRITDKFSSVHHNICCFYKSPTISCTLAKPWRTR